MRSGIDANGSVIEITRRRPTRRFGNKVALDQVQTYRCRASCASSNGQAPAVPEQDHAHPSRPRVAQSSNRFGARLRNGPGGRSGGTILARIGYLSERRTDLPGWMRSAEFVRYARAFYPATGRYLRRGTRRRSAPVGHAHQHASPRWAAGSACSWRWRTGPKSSFWTNPLPVSIPLSGGTFWRPSSAPSRTKGARSAVLVPHLLDGGGAGLRITSA